MNRVNESSTPCDHNIYVQNSNEETRQCRASDDIVGINYRSANQKGSEIAFLSANANGDGCDFPGIEMLVCGYDNGSLRIVYTLSLFSVYVTTASVEKKLRVIFLSADFSHRLQHFENSN